MSVGQSSNTFIHNSIFGSFASQINHPTANQIVLQSIIHTVPPPIMVSWFAPLVLPSLLHNFPQNYAQRIRLYDAEEYVSSQQHLDRLTDFVDL